MRFSLSVCITPRRHRRDDGAVVPVTKEFRTRVPRFLGGKNGYSGETRPLARCASPIYTLYTHTCGVENNGYSALYELCHTHTSTCIRIQYFVQPSHYYYSAAVCRGSGVCVSVSAPRHILYCVWSLRRVLKFCNCHWDRAN